MMDFAVLAPTRSSAWVNLAYAMTKEGRLEDAMSAYLLAFKFSQNQQKTREFLTKQLQEDTDPKLREMAGRVLQEIGS
jgi:DNA polymerase III delta prime subunit